MKTSTRASRWKRKEVQAMMARTIYDQVFSVGVLVDADGGGADFFLRRRTANTPIKATRLAQ